MGHGLRPKPKGLHIAFAAGTGVLCFVDFVASLIQDKLNLHEQTVANLTQRTQSSGSRNILMHALGDSIVEQEPLIGIKTNKHSVAIKDDAFQFHFYVAYSSWSETIALELFEAFHAYCKRHNFADFRLHIRLPGDGEILQRWDDTFIREKINLYGAKNIQRLWICGTPAMSESFDRLLSQPAQQRANQVSN